MPQTKNDLGIVTGFGRLSEEVIALADKLPGGFARYKVRPWFPLLTDPVGVVSDVFGKSKGTLAIDPFQFADIERMLEQKGTKRLFFTGDFPRTRFIQAQISSVWGTLTRIGDQKCVKYFNETSDELAQPIRYFLALSRLLDELSVKILLAHEVFPELNIKHGCASRREPPPEILHQLPALLASVGKHLALAPRERNRFAQAVIVDNGIIREVEARGTNDLIRRYGKRKTKRLPYLLKPPSVEFNPALDQPTIGPDTVDCCLAAGVKGLVVCAETTTIANKPVTIQRIDEYGMFLYGVPFHKIRQIYIEHFPDTWMRNASITEQPH